MEEEEGEEEEEEEEEVPTQTKFVFSPFPPFYFSFLVHFRFNFSEIYFLLVKRGREAFFSSAKNLPVLSCTLGLIVFLGGENCQWFYKLTPGL